MTGNINNVDWKGKINSLYVKLLQHGTKAGRTASRPLLQFYFVMADDSTSILDKALIYAAIIYVISPVDFIPAAVFKFIGILDDGAAILYIYNKIKNKITPEINEKVNATLNKWFGAEYEAVK